MPSDKTENAKNPAPSEETGFSFSQQQFTLYSKNNASQTMTLTDYLQRFTEFLKAENLQQPQVYLELCREIENEYQQFSKTEILAPVLALLLNYVKFIQAYLNVKKTGIIEGALVESLQEAWLALGKAQKNLPATFVKDIYANNRDDLNVLYQKNWYEHPKLGDGAAVYLSDGKCYLAECGISLFADQLFSNVVNDAQIALDVCQAQLSKTIEEIEDTDLRSVALEV